jgi:hypothetical protein
MISLTALSTNAVEIGSPFRRTGLPQDITDALQAEPVEAGETNIRQPQRAKRQWGNRGSFLARLNDPGVMSGARQRCGGVRDARQHGQGTDPAALEAVADACQQGGGECQGSCHLGFVTTFLLSDPWHGPSWRV